ncbi:hypothetical protein WL226_12440, partial [Staphylococcus epidermidis]
INSDDRQRSFTKDGQLIQVLDLVQTGTGFGNAVVNHSNIVYNQSNSQVVNGEVPAANGAAAFQLEKVIKSNYVSEGIMGVVYKTHLFLT